MKIVRTDMELQMPITDAALRKAGHEVILLPLDVTEDQLAAELADADLLLIRTGHGAARCGGGAQGRRDP